jgi:Protein of unknown function, DUF481
MPRYLCYLCIAGAWSVSGGISAQNAVPTIRKSKVDEKTGAVAGDGWSGKIGFGYALNYPNYISGVFQFSEVSYEFANQRILASSETSGTIENGSIKRPNGVLNAGYDYNIDRIRLFAYTNYEFGVVTGLESNTVLGAGVRYTFIKFDRFVFDSGIAPIYERTAYVDDTLNETLSISLRGRIKVFLADFDSLYITWLFLQSTNESKNQWHAAEIINNTVLSHRISIRQAYRWRYDVFSGSSAGLAYLIAVFNFD